MLGNYIGTNAAGDNLGNTDIGIRIQVGASGNTIGGSEPGAGNVVGFSGNDGIEIAGFGVPTTGNLVLGNFVGTNATGANLGNASAGVVVADASANIIGGTAAGASNTIGFSGTWGISIGRFSDPTTGNVVAGNFVGTNAAGASLGNVRDGVLIQDASANVVGGNAPGAGNTIGFSGDNGVRIVAFEGRPATSNEVQGNFVGTNAAGEALGNGVDGVVIQDASGNIVGGSTPGAGNTVGFSGRLGVVIFGNEDRPATSNEVQGNFVGTNAAGAALGNGEDGIFIQDGSGNIVGGSTPGAGNTIGFSGRFGVAIVGLEGRPATSNEVQGNFVGTNAAGEALGNGEDGIFIQDASGNIVGGSTPGAGNTIGFSGASGIQIRSLGGQSAADNVVEGNFIGTNAAGSDLGNGQFGILVLNASDNFVGGMVPGAGNVVGFNLNGIGLGGLSATGNIIQGNFVGTNSAGANLANVSTGIAIQNASDNLIGGTAPGAGNVFGFSDFGIFFSDLGTTGNIAQGNFVGTNEAGANLAHNVGGIRIQNASGNTIGGSQAGAGNTVGFSSPAIQIVQFSSPATGNVVQGNFVGTNAAGADLGSGNEQGITIQDAAGSVVGGSEPGAGNTVGFSTFGIALLGASDVVTEYLVQGNFVGTNAAGDDLGNTAYGILAFDTSDSAIEANTVRYSAGTGILIGGSPTLSVGNAILGNRVSDNALLGIDLSADPDGNADGVTANDGCGDPDAGPNGLQDFPLLLSAQVLGGMTTVAFDLDTAPGDYRVEFFAVPAADASGFGEGETFIGAETVTVSAGCSGNFQATMPLPSEGNFITATATLIDAMAPFGFGSTSEFAAVIAIESEVSPITVNTLDGGNDGICGSDGQDESQDCSLLEAVELANSSSGVDEVRFDVDGTIQVSAEVVIADTMILDGSTAPGGAHAVRIDASASGDNAISIAGVGAARSEVRGLVVGNAPGAGILINAGAESVRIVGNYIGTNAAGDDLGNGGEGVSIFDGSTDNTIGGGAPGQGNIIGFNAFNGVFVGGAKTTGNSVLGNFIGADPAGNALGNGLDGVRVNLSAKANTIGAAGPGEGNTIGFNLGNGVLVTGGASGNDVLGNFIGTNAAGDDLGNVSDGVAISGASTDNRVGGPASGEANTIGFNDASGIFLGDSGTTGNSVLGNFIGTNAAGANLGHGRDGIAIGRGASANTIGGAALSEGNTIGFSGLTGVLLFSAGTMGNSIQGNFIGTNAAGQNLGNMSHGIVATFGASGNVLGGTAPGAGNAIGFNNRSGVLVSDATTQSNAVLGNAIFDNAALGIDLSADTTVGDDVTANDGCGDPDAGPNGYQNFPTLVSAQVRGGTTTIVFDLDTSEGDHRIEFFSVLAADPSGHGEGRSFLGAEQVIVSATCDETFQVDLELALPADVLITATATPLDAGQSSGFGNTSEFSAAVMVEVIDQIFGDRFESLLP